MNDTTVTPRQVRAGVLRHGRGTAEETAAVDPDHDRPAVLRGQAGAPDVQMQAVLALRGPEVDSGVGDLHGGRAEGRGVADAVPGLGRSRWCPPQLADRRRGVGDAEEPEEAVALGAVDDACLLYTSDAADE